MASTVTLDYVEIVEKDGELTVWPFFTGVDRPQGSGYAVKNRKMAERLKAAMEAGVVHTDVHAATDVNGKTFATYRSTVLGRMMNADLTRLGF